MLCPCTTTEHGLHWCCFAPVPCFLQYHSTDRRKWLLHCLAGKFPIVCRFMLQNSISISTLVFSKCKKLSQQNDATTDGIAKKMNVTPRWVVCVVPRKNIHYHWRSIVESPTQSNGGQNLNSPRQASGAVSSIVNGAQFVLVANGSVSLFDLYAE